MKRIERIHVLKVGDSVSADAVETFHTREDLLELANSYDPNVHEAPTVLGHDSDKDWSQLMSRDDSEPSYGWIVQAYVEGNDLYVDIDASDELVKFIDEKRYKKRSLGYYGRKSKSNPKPGQLYIRHLAMLGASPPAIKGLDNIKLAESERPMSNKKEINELLDTNAEEWLAFILKDEGNIVRETIVAFDPKPSEENNWLLNVDKNKFEGAFITDKEQRFLFEIILQGEGDASEVIVSVKPELSQEEAQIEEDKQKDVQEVAESIEEEPTPVEEKAADELEDQAVDEEDPDKQFGENKMGQLVKEKTTTEKEYMEPDMKNENMEYRDDGHVDPDEAKAGMDTPRTSVDAVKDTEMAECGECGDKVNTEEEAVVEEAAVVEEEKEAGEYMEPELGEPEKTETTLEADPAKGENPGEPYEEPQYEEGGDVDIEAMKEELAMLRAKVRKQEEEENKKREEEMVRFTEALYTEHQILETQFPKEELIEFFKGLHELGNEHMVYGESKKSIVETLKTLLSNLPKQAEEKVQLAEGLLEAPKKRNAVKFNPNFSRGSEERRQKILAIMKEREIPQTDMYAYSAINAELTREFGPYDR